VVPEHGIAMQNSRLPTKLGSYGDDIAVSVGKVLARQDMGMELKGRHAGEKEG
jgi:hypothetical protein